MNRTVRNLVEYAAASVVVFGALGLIGGDWARALVYGVTITAFHTVRDWWKAHRADKQKENDDE
ncbi:hypothetical protein [Streptomyces sp. NPDC102360]|uniref:hypothetical protein n=1 Tax=Streptomyces sp. NPDC102360 TaxID=3366160 RepID=UPI0037F34C50